MSQVAGMNDVLVKSTLSAAEFWQMPRRALLADWFGQKIEHAPEYRLIQDPEKWHLSGAYEGSGQFAQNLKAGSFVEGLWEQDLVELFLLNQKSGRYVELNLSPTGAWWSALLTGPRQRNKELPNLPIQILKNPRSPAWEIGLSVPKAALAELLQGPVTHANVTFIVGHPKPHFCSSSPLGPGQPDFHRPHAFLPVQNP